VPGKPNAHWLRAAFLLDTRRAAANININKVQQQQQQQQQQQATSHQDKAMDHLGK
jgi:hypothetical protein